MKFTTSAHTLIAAVTAAAHATPRNPSMIAYSGVLVRVADGTVTVTGSDGDTTISARVIPEPGSDLIDGSVLLAPDPITAYLRSLPATETIVVSCDDNTDVAVGTTGRSPYRFRHLQATFPNPTGVRATPVEVDFDTFADGVASVRAVAAAATTPAALLESDGTQLAMYATDTYRVVRATMVGPGFGTFRGVVSLAVLEQVARAHITRLAADERSNLLRFIGPDVTITARLVVPDFPDVAALLDMSPPARTSCDPSQLAAALKHLGSVVGNEPVRCTFDSDRLELSVSNQDRGDGAEVLAVTPPVPAPHQTLLSARYLTDMVAAHVADQLSVGWSDPQAPVVFRSTDSVEVTTVIAALAGGR